MTEIQNFLVPWDILHRQFAGFRVTAESHALQFQDSATWDLAIRHRCSLKYEHDFGCEIVALHRVFTFR